MKPHLLGKDHFKKATLLKAKSKTPMYHSIQMRKFDVAYKHIQHTNERHAETQA